MCGVGCVPLVEAFKGLWLSMIIDGESWII